MNNKVTINKGQKLYVIPEGKGYSCYGFANCIAMRDKLAVEYNRLDLTKGNLGTIKAYNEYEALRDIAHRQYNLNGKRSVSGLNEKLIGLEGKRVEVVYIWGDTERFYVGRSTGWIPCHLEIKRCDSHGGGSVMSAESMKSVKVLY